MDVRIYKCARCPSIRMGRLMWSHSSGTQAMICFTCYLNVVYYAQKKERVKMQGSFSKREPPPSLPRPRWGDDEYEDEE